VPTSTPTPLSSRQPSPDRPDPIGRTRSEARPTLLTTLAVCAVLVVASAFTLKLLPEGGSGAEPPVEETAETAALPYGADAVSQLAGLSTLEPVAAEATRQATRALQDTQAVAAASFDAAVADALLALEAAVANSSLPALPEGYLPGAAVSVRLPPPEAYTLPRLPALPAVGGMALGDLQGDPSPAGSRGGETLPLGDLLAQLEDAEALLEGLLGDLPVEGLPVGLDSLPVGGLDGLPVGGSSPAQGAEGAVNPDEEGAVLADRHAGGLLTATSSAYAQTQARLASLLVGYQALTEQVEMAIAETRQLEEETGTTIQSTLEERLVDIEAEALRLETQADRLVAEHARAVAKAQAQTEASLQKVLRDQVDAVEGTSERAAADLEARVAEVQAQAQVRQAKVLAIVELGAAELSKPGAPADAAQHFEALQAAAAAAIEKIGRDARAEIAALGQASAQLEANTRAAVRALEDAAEDVRGQLNSTVTAAVADGLEVKSYLVAVAQAQAELAGDRETRLAAETLVELDAIADQHVEGLVRSGLRSAAAADSILEDTEGLVGQVEGLVVGEVGKDLEYIQKVSEDYRKVPTEDRRERAIHWSTAAAGIEDILQDTLAAGPAIEGLAARTVQAAQQAQAELQALE
jgi:hypothetical protein